MTDRNLHQELLDELEAKRPVIEGYEYLSEDPLGNLTYSNLETETLPAGTHYKVLIGGSIENVQELKFHVGNPENGINGITLETLIDIGIARTIKLNERVEHWHNNLVVDGLNLAANALNKRHLDRKEANVTNEDTALPRKGREDFHPIVNRLITNQDKFTFILTMMLAMAESYEQVVDGTAQTDFIEMTPEGPKRRINVTPEEDEAVTIAVASSQKVLAVVETSQFLQTVLGTMVHGKKLAGQNQADTTTTSEPVAE